MRLSSPLSCAPLNAAAAIALTAGVLAAPAPAAAQDCAGADAILSAQMPADLAQREAAYRTVLGPCPNHAGVLNNLADTYEQMGRFDDAITHYHRAAEVFRQANRSPATPYFGLGDVYRKMRRDSDALYWYRKGLEFDPANRDTLAAVAELTRNDPKNIVGSRSIAGAINPSRGAVVKPVAMNEQVLPFAFNSAQLLPEARPQLREIAHAIYDQLDMVGTRGAFVAGATIAVIEGHADRRGSSEYNMTLARRRAEAVIDVLVNEFRIPRSRLQAVSQGAAQPKCQADTEDCHAQNRRVEIRRP